MVMTNVLIVAKTLIVPSLMWQKVTYLLIEAMPHANEHEFP